MTRARSAPDIDELVARALAARNAAYAPYSGFAVGCAVFAGGAIFAAANVENASYGLALCAERNAIAQAVQSGARELALAAVASDASPPATPCGMCLQTMVEFARAPEGLAIVCVNPRGERLTYTLAQLLPHAFHL